MILKRFEQPDWLSNTWLVAAGEGGPALLVDAGADAGPILEAVRRHRLQVEKILLTHHHHDHVAEARSLARETGARIVAHPEEVPLFGRPGMVHEPLRDGEEFLCGTLSVKAVHVPGHTAGQLTFHIETVGLFTGDTLFAGSIGGTVAPGHTSFSDLRASLLEKLMVYPDDTPVLPGHRLPTTIGEERRQNPFLRVLTGLDPEGEESGVFAGRPVRLIVWAHDYDGGYKAWVRFENGRDEVVPGSRVKR
jgi:glyoxylase-like metal-dependent hydrolase (beta-lactamase superfamily II)